MSSLWVPSMFQTCGAFAGLRGVSSGKRAKVFPGKRAGLSGDATRPTLLRNPLGTPLANPQPGAEETRVADTLWPTPSWPQLWEGVDFPWGRWRREGSVCVASPLTKRSAVIRRICYQFLRCPSLAPPRAPRPSEGSESARGQQQSAQPSRKLVGACVSVHACECMKVHECTRARLRPMGTVNFAAGAASEGRPCSPPPPPEET